MVLEGPPLTRRSGALTDALVDAAVCVVGRSGGPSAQWICANLP